MIKLHLQIRNLFLDHEQILSLKVFYHHLLSLKFILYYDFANHIFITYSHIYLKPKMDQINFLKH